MWATFGIDWGYGRGGGANILRDGGNVYQIEISSASFHLTLNTDFLPIFSLFEIIFVIFSIKEVLNYSYYIKLFNPSWTYSTFDITWWWDFVRPLWCRDPPTIISCIFMFYYSFIIIKIFKFLFDFCTVLDTGGGLTGSVSNILKEI